MIADDETVTVIDFPQMVSTSHENAQFYFARDVRCIQRFFTKRFRLHFEGIPVLESDVERKVDLDSEIKASGAHNGVGAEQMAEFDRANEQYLATVDTGAAESADEGDDAEFHAEIATAEEAVPVEGEEGTRHVTFSDEQTAESKRLIQEEIGSSSEEEEEDEEAKQEEDAEAEAESSVEDVDSDGEFNQEKLDAAQAETDAKRAKKLLPKVEKPVRVTKKQLEAMNEEGELQVNMDYVKKKAKR